MKNLPTVRLLPKQDRRFNEGSPWVFANQIDMAKAPKDLPAGSLVRLENAAGEAVAQAFFNRHSLIAARVISRSSKEAIDRAFFVERLTRALLLREKLFDRPFYRLIHAEADGLPGTIVDRFGDEVVVQINTAGMELQHEAFLDALKEVVKPRAILLKDDQPERQLEGLPGGERQYLGQMSSPLQVEENGAQFLADPSGGQKTGWFFDQRDNRAWAARFARGARVLDAYCYAGGFAVMAALGGAKDVVALDRSEGALELAKLAAKANGVDGKITFQRAEVFQRLTAFAGEGRQFDLTICDPPAFIPTRKEQAQGLKGYRKLARLAAQVTAQGGFMVMASCSHHALAADFTAAVGAGISDIGRKSRILRLSGAAADHPVHPFLPESAYLKCLTLALD